MKFRKIYFIPILFLPVLAGFFIRDNFNLIANRPAKQYLAYPISCSYEEKQEKPYSTIRFDFTSFQKTPFKIPIYKIQENLDTGITKIIFQNTYENKNGFLYEEIINNPLILNLNYYNEGSNFIVEIERRGAFLPTEIKQNSQTANIILKDGSADYPAVFDQKPKKDSTAYPSPSRQISFKAILNNPLKRAVIIFDGKTITDFDLIEVSKNQYSFSFYKEVLKDKEYAIKTIITDNSGKTTVNYWTFEGKIPIDGILGPDRFMYQGWWGEINANEVSLRKEPAILSEKFGALSSVNTVKILKEVLGEEIDGNNLWYQIDGGTHPGAYIFSAFVTPMVQPMAPENFTVPEGVGESEYWLDVNLTKKILTLFSYNQPVFTTYVSIGRPENPTQEGIYNIWYKITKKRMQGGPPLHIYKYDLANVPNVLFYYGSYAIHGTYWHDKFGSQQSAGCTNMTQGDAAFIFDKIKPQIPEGKSSVFSSEDNAGTTVYNHY